MFVITGAAGFIGSCLTQYLNENGHHDLILVDDFSREDKTMNLEGKQFLRKIARDDFPRWLQEQGGKLTAVFHLGARTDTTEKDEAIFDRLNFSYSQEVWRGCAQHGLPLVYASSAATYGAGEFGYRDEHALVEDLGPLNPYGRSKNDFDRWALQQAAAPPFWYGLKFFNVYGPNEYHKGRMASVIWHTSRQIRATGKMKLFRSHRDDFADGHQARDFIYVKDVLEVMWWLFENRPESGLYNLGSGRARTFLDLVRLTFRALGKEPDIDFIDTPVDIRDTYQYFTQADMSKLRAAGYDREFHSLEAGIEDYVGKYLYDELNW